MTTAINSKPITLDNGDIILYSECFETKQGNVIVSQVIPFDRSELMAHTYCVVRAVLNGVNVYDDSQCDDEEHSDIVLIMVLDDLCEQFNND